jgi:hypothetical protein|tara:strand:- start:164 stop:511 length:348 start_codon:yes stop_codon:yes gene_type:complete
MIQEIVWVLNPIKHRQVQRLTAEVNYDDTKKAYEEQGFFFIDTLVENNIPDDLWICDFCNVQIDIEISMPKGIVVVDNNALCQECFDKSKKYIGKKTLEGNCPNLCCKQKEEYAR